MKKLLLSGIATFALMASVPAQAGGLDLTGGTGVARTPLAMSLAPMQFQIAGDYVFSEDTFVPMRAALGLPYGIEIGGAYWFVDPSFADDLMMWDLTAKWVLPKFVENLGLAGGGHYYKQEIDFKLTGNVKVTAENDGHDLYGVATYVVPLGEGMALPVTAGVRWESRTGDNDEDAFKFFGSLLFKTSQFAVGGEYEVADEDLDGKDTDDYYWFGGRFFLNPMITLQAGYINNADFGGDDMGDGVFHLGAQFAFGGAM